MHTYRQCRKNSAYDVHCYEIVKQYFSDVRANTRVDGPTTRSIRPDCRLVRAKTRIDGPETRSVRPENRLVRAKIRTDSPQTRSSGGGLFFATNAATSGKSVMPLYS